MKVMISLTEREINALCSVTDKEVAQHFGGSWQERDSARRGAIKALRHALRVHRTAMKLYRDFAG